MAKRLALYWALAVAALVALAVIPALAHTGTGETKIQVEPASVTAGGTVVLAVSGLEPDSDRALVLVGQNLTVNFGTEKTDADGMIQKELTIPAHLPGGTYELQCIGDETLTVSLAITAAAGGAAATPAPDETEAVGPRPRSALELGAFAVLILLVAALGAVLVLRAERFRGAVAE